MAGRNDLLDQLKRLTSAQFDEVLFRLKIEPWNIPGPFAEQVLRATKVILRLEQEDEGLNLLEQTLADPIIETIGKQYEGYETEAEVRKVVGEYTQQPLAGRSVEQEKINQFLAQNASGVLLLTAPAGFGKSSLLTHWQQTRQEDYFIAFHCFRTSSSVLRSVPNAYRHLLRQLYVYYNRHDQQFPSDLRSQIRGLVDDAQAQSGKRLVIVLDGLDEAQETFEPFLSSSLPDGVYMIASARAEEGDEPEYLQGWTTNAQRLPLKRLPREAISDWVARVDRLAHYARDHSFIEKLDEVTTGFPLYLRYLLDDLNQAADKGNDVRALLPNSPMGFAEYVKKQFGQLAKDVKQQTEVRGLFVLLSAALGSLSTDDIYALTGLGTWDLPTLPWQITRWFSVRSDSYSFAHPLLANQFQVVLGSSQIAQANRDLTDYCSKWKENKSSYALRYYAEHLKEAKKLEVLYELARDEEFTAAQRQGIPDEPELTLNAVKLALQGKTQEDKADGMAEFILLHARRKIQIAQVSPLNALQAGNLEAAWRLAAQSNRDDCILWHLLLAWALLTGDEQHKPDLERTRETLDRLQSMQLPHLLGWKADSAVYLLGKLLPVLENYSSLVKQVLDNEGLKDLCGELIKHKPGQTDSLKVALITAQQIENSSSKADALIAIAKAQAAARYLAAAQMTLKTALIITQQIEDSHDKADALIAIAEAQAKAGDPSAAQTTLNTAFTIAQQMKDSSRKAYALSYIAEAQAKAGDPAAAQRTLKTAFTTAQQMENSYVLGNISEAKAKTLRAIAKAQAETGDPAAAQMTLKTAFTTVQQMENSYDKAYVLITIAKAQAEAGEPAAVQTTLNAAFTTAQQMENSFFKAHALGDIVEAQAEAGDLTAVQTTLNATFTTAQQMENSYDKAYVLAYIAKAQAEADPAAAQMTLNTALTTAQRVENLSSKADALIAIAKSQTEAGDLAAAQMTLKTALTTAQQMENLSSKADALSYIAEAQAKAGDPAAALTTARQMENSEDKAYALSYIAEAQTKAGDPTAALTTAQQMENLEDKAYALSHIAEAQTKAGDRAAAQMTLNTALIITQQIEDSHDKADALIAIAEAQAKAGDLTDVQTTLNAAFITAQQMENSFRKACVLGDIAEAQAEAGDPAAAQTTLKTALTTAQQMKNSHDKAYVLSCIATIQAKTGNSAAAQMNLNTAQQIKDSSRKAHALGDIAEAQTEAGEPAAAQMNLNTAQQIEDSSRKADALRDIAIARANAQFGEQAVAVAEKIMTNRNTLLPEIAAAFVKANYQEDLKRNGFKQLLIPCADYLDAAYKMCGYLAQLYPKQATAVAEEVSKFSTSFLVK
jgi:ATP/maltotriose-dependent transcriptional regulator MalT